MIVDLILDRKDNEELCGKDTYSAKYFYLYCMKYNAIFDGGYDYITLAMDYGTENDVKQALCKYIEEGEYNPKIKEYINSKKWI